MLKQVDRESFSRESLKYSGTANKNGNRQKIHKSARSVKIKESKFDVDNFYDSIDSDRLLDQQMSDLKSIKFQ